MSAAMALADIQHALLSESKLLRLPVVLIGGFGMCIADSW